MTEVALENFKPIKCCGEHQTPERAENCCIEGVCCSDILMEDQSTVCDNIEIKLEDQITPNDYQKWESQFELIFDNMSQEFELKKLFRRIRIKTRINTIASKLCLPCSWRLSFNRENEQVRKIIQEIILRIRKLDDASLVEIEKCLENSVEGLMKLRPHIDVEKLAEMLKSYC